MTERNNWIQELDFETVLRLKQNKLKKALETGLSKAGYTPVSKKGYLYAAGTVPVLLVAHLDTVHLEPVRDICYTYDGNIVMSPQGIGGDDRCGIWMILQIIRRVNCSVLFCEDEEIGCVGARKFTQSGQMPNVNYIVEMDRRGADDAVFYHCDNPEFKAFVLNFGFREAQGSCSDISYLAPHLDVAAVNISSGYYNEHRLHEYIDIRAMEENIERVCNMVQAPSGRFEYRERTSFRDRRGEEADSLWHVLSMQAGQNYVSMAEIGRSEYVKIGKMHLPKGRYCVDMKNNVYRYIPELRAAVRIEQAEVCKEDGKRPPYNAAKQGRTRQIRVLSFPEAAELLRRSG